MNRVAHNLGSSKIGVGVVIAIIALLISAILYFVLWRPSSGEIESTSSKIITLKTSIDTTIPSDLVNLSKTSAITPELATKFQSDIDEYRAIVDYLKQSPAIQHNAPTATQYRLMNTKLEESSKSLASLATSVTNYSTAVTACDKLMSLFWTLETKDNFAQASAACNKALTSSSSSTNNSFDRDFLDNYKLKAVDLLAAYSNYVTVGANERTSAANAIVSASKELAKALSVTVTFDYNAPPSSDLDALLKALDDQKQSFIR